jgi:hypothetical protein
MYLQCTIWVAADATTGGSQKKALPAGTGATSCRSCFAKFLISGACSCDTTASEHDDTPTTQLMAFSPLAAVGPPPPLATKLFWRRAATAPSARCNRGAEIVAVANVCAQQAAVPGSAREGKGSEGKATRRWLCVYAYYGPIQVQRMVFSLGYQLCAASVASPRCPSSNETRHSIVLLYYDPVEIHGGGEYEKTATTGHDSLLLGARPRKIVPDAMPIAAASQLPNRANQPRTRVMGPYPLPHWPAGDTTALRATFLL